MYLTIFQGKISMARTYVSYPVPINRKFGVCHFAKEGEIGAKIQDVFLQNSMHEKRNASISETPQIDELVGDGASGRRCIFAIPGLL